MSERETPASSNDRGQRARALAGFFAAGALLSTTVIALPGFEGMHRPGLAVTVALAAASAVLLYVLSRHIGRLLCNAFLMAGTGLIAACQILAGGGSATASYALLYLWVVLHASLFLSPAVVAAHLVATTAAHAAALLWLGERASLAPQLAIFLGTQIAAALVVGSLAAKLRGLADTDPLTGLGNRRRIERILGTASGTRRHRAATLHLALLDLDGFKTVNDELGHAAGDRVLVEAASAWRAQLRRTDTLARTGGDEFTVVLADCEPAEAEQLVRRLLGSTPNNVSCSAGLARWDGRESTSELISRADAALYRAKACGPLVVAVTSGNGSAPTPEVPVGHPH